MSIDTVNDLPPRVQYVASAAQDEFDYPFPIFSDGDLVVVVDGAEQALDTDYTVAGEGDDTGGTITFIAPMEGDELVTIYRDIAIERDTDIAQNGPWSSTTYNDEQDKIFLLLQQLKSSINRSLRLSITADVDDDELEISSAFANTYLTFDADLKPTPAVLSATTMTREIIGQLLYPTSQAEIDAGVSITLFYEPYGYVTRYGAVGDNTTDCAAAFQSAVDQAVEDAGAEVYLPQPATAYVLNAQIDVASGRPIKIKGSGWGWTSSGVGGPAGGCIVRLAGAAGTDAAIFDWADFVMGVHIEGIHFYMNTVGNAHRALRFQEALQVLVTNCRFEGASSASDDQYGIELLDATDLGGTYTGAFNIVGNYFTTVRYGVVCHANCTTMQITHNNFSGFTGSVNAVWLKALTVGLRVCNNRIEGFDVGLLDEGNGNDFSHNYCENNTVTQDRSAASLPMSTFNTIISGGAAVTPSDRTEAMMLIQPRTFIVDDTYAEFGRGYREFYRDFALGQPQNYTPSFSGSSSMTFTSVTTSTVTGSTTLLWYTVFSNGYVDIEFMIDGTVGGTPDAELRFTLPSGFNDPTGRTRRQCTVFNNGAYQSGWVEVRDSEAFARVSLVPNASWTAGSAGCYGFARYRIG